MKHGSLFSGVGGWSIASDQIGWPTSFMCEWDENKQYVLKHHWPNAEIYGDITTTDFTIWRGRIDILTASTPCQPFSNAGKRQGANDVRHLWPATLRSIHEIQPRFFVLENVPGLVNWSKGMVFKQIIADLENEGYEVLPFLLPACGVGAPHKRERIWIVAQNTKCNGWTGKQRESESGIRRLRDISSGDNERLSSNNGEIRTTANTGLFRSPGAGEQTTGIEQCYKGITSDSPNPGIEGLQQQEVGAYKTSPTSDSAEQRQQRGSFTGKQPTHIRSERSGQSRIAPDTGTNRFRCKEHGQKEPGGITENGIRNNWSDFPAVSPLRTGDDGFSRDSLRLFINENSGGLLTEKEVDQIIQKSLNKWNNLTIAAGGDAVVPGVVLQIFKTINEYNNL